MIETNDLRNSVTEVARYWGNDPYYDRAEKPDWMTRFWSQNREFKPLFDQLDLEWTIELACGHGRHATQIADHVPALVLVDVVPQNIEYCRQRFAGRNNIAVMQNDGASFRPIPDEQATAIYCYDAMVHFEMDVVASYVKDTYRVLRPGGRALYHHSNYDQNPGGDHRNSPNGRNFMTQALFFHLAARAGLRVLGSVLMDWTGIPQQDALTLLERP